MEQGCENDLVSRVIQVIAKSQHLEPGAIKPESTFVELGIDSLDGLQILFALEEEFEVNIPDDAGKEFDSIAKASEGIRQLMEAKQAAASGA